jgi:hypothetical protein
MRTKWLERGYWGGLWIVNFMGLAGSGVQTPERVAKEDFLAQRLKRRL